MDKETACEGIMGEEKEGSLGGGWVGEVSDESLIGKLLFLQR